jgi:hypothetical protein
LHSTIYCISLQEYLKTIFSLLFEPTLKSQDYNSAQRIFIRQRSSVPPAKAGHTQIQTGERSASYDLRAFSWKEVARATECGSRSSTKSEIDQESQQLEARHPDRKRRDSGNGELFGIVGVGSPVGRLLTTVPVATHATSRL